MEPTNSPSPASKPGTGSLPADINAATRQLHTQLNRLITDRLPLALPPHAKTPELYAKGLRHFAHVYLTFESAWRDIRSATATSPALSCLLEDPWVSVSKQEASLHTTSRVIDGRILSFLSRLQPPGLERSRRLRSDLAALTGLSGVDLDVQLARYPSEQVKEYSEHIRQAVTEKPHVLVAYAWVMYMAIFSGGRWIRAELSSAGETFWKTAEKASDNNDLFNASTGEVNHANLAFLCFDGDLDGEDIKTSFKERLQEGEEIFSQEQRQDIVSEATEIFRRSILLVEELDGLLDTPKKLPRNRRWPASVQFAEGTATDQKPASAARKHHDNAWLYVQGFTGLAFVVSCVSWYAYTTAM